ncbi:hypothetical protein NCU16706 [Neurospora crassa OR74A]|uniref:Chromo domain-containing protein n=1 Tax=Neurospora crassa (strain ATCC 24698 / 74-OR23-1A / CBS 708.71 / DSM 1257 / FGSC 987) TaxID=367110 RepID=U9WHC5_NEUCR|nr:hypothetical protein NCU16706 [Neurospora crassa OR74A]ESA43448.1 hypothetical protein NCU16706 [Neurospora crassa OR74A]|eukprot:XP_011394070.1 hypothetical protein NCU16706 [Neurospora crassa OR74A]
MSSLGSSSFEPPTTPSFSLPTITEHATAPATPVGGSLIPARDKDVHLEFGVNSLAGQEQESVEDIEMGEDAQTSDDAEMEDVASTADVLSAAVSRTDTLSPFEPTPVDSRAPGDVPTLSPINEQSGHCCKDSLRASGDLDEPRTSVAEPPERVHDASTPQTETSSEVVSDSSESACTSCPQEAKKPAREDKTVVKVCKVAKEPKWEVHGILTSAILSDGLLYHRVSWKG